MPTDQVAADYWNHDSAYHPWIIRQIPTPGGRLLDVGCGEGLLVQRLAPHGRQVLGLEPDPSPRATVERRAAYCRKLGYDVRVVGASFEAFTEPEPFDLITFVASIHQTDLVASLSHAKNLLNPGGRLVIVGVSWHRDLPDKVLYALTLPLIRGLDRLHHKPDDVGVAIIKADRTLAELKAVYREHLPGHRVRRGLYYRHLLTWAKPD